MAAFSYQPLEGQEIRVITIRKGSWNEQISCTLEHIDLQTESPPKFIALSYVWGDPRATQEIALNGHAFHISANLKIALQRIREPSPDWPLWVDAVCINQGDALEIKDQIPRMGPIYSSAKVLAFLGENSPKDDSMICNIFQTAQQLVGKLSSVAEFDNFINQCDYRPLTKRYIPKDEIPRLLEDTRDFMEQFFKRAWFSRVWTFQEICLPRNPQQPPDIMCGPYIIPITWLGIFWRAIWSSLETPEDRILYASTRQIFQIAEARGQFGARKSPKDTSELAHQLMDILQQVHGRKATQPQDVIYGVLGMMDVNDSLFPNELKPVVDPDFEEVYYRYAKFLFEQTGCLALMSTTESHLQRHPTWVPDFRFLCPQRNPAARNTVSFSADGKKMCVLGFEVDKVAAFFERSHVPIEATGEALRVFEETFLKKAAQIRGIPLDTMIDEWLRPPLKMQHKAHVSLGGGLPMWLAGSLGAMLNAAARGIISRLSGDGSAFENVYAKYRECYNYLTADTVNLPGDLEAHRKFLNGLVIGAQLLTSSGKLGVYYRRSTTLIKGDILCFFKGSSSMSVLRPSANGCFSFLGTCDMKDVDPTNQYSEQFFSSRSIKEWWLV